MTKRQLHDEYYQKALLLNRQGNKKEAETYARKAIDLARQMYETAGMPYVGGSAESLLDLIQSHP
ncbi:MAG: hypothetical protein C4521_00680 [Actinobacteria bacterium]|nr:MAG: hypothetical protein C4521_00680 [Actinomycetota bacterium]